MIRAALLCLLFLFTAASPAGAEIRLIDSKTGASRSIVRDTPEPRLIRFADDASVLVRRRGHVLRIRVADGNVRRVPWLDAADAVGPDGRSLVLHRGADDRARVVLREADGRPLGAYDFEDSFSGPDVAWSRDGARVAIAMSPILQVIDTATGALLLHGRFDDELELTTQAWAPDAGALVIANGSRLLRLDVPSGAPQELFRGPVGSAPGGYWGETGRIVVNDGDRVRVLDDPPLTARTGSDRLSGVAWSLNGSALTFSYSGPLDDCDFPDEGLAALVPGQTRRALVRPRYRAIVRYAESPDGRFPAVDLKPAVMSHEPERRGKRRPCAHRC